MSTDDRRAFSQAALQSLPARYEGRLALFVQRLQILLVRLSDLRVEDDVLIAPYRIVATHGFANREPSGDDVVSAPASELFATATYLCSGHPYWQMLFDPAIIARAVDIVAALPAGTTVEDDYLERPPPAGSKFVMIRAPGPVAHELQTFIRAQVDVEYRAPNLLRPRGEG